MSTNGFREEELVSRRVKVGNEWQTKVFPVVGGRLRIIHETSSHLNIPTEIIKLEPDFAVVRATLESEKGRFCGTGTASAQRDARLADSLVELAETRAIARSLRFGGVGVEFTSAEEVSHVATAEPERVFAPGDNKKEKLAQPCANNGAQSKAPSDAIDPSSTEQTRPTPGTAGGNGSKAQRCGIEKPHSNGVATTAQVRALWALSKRADYTDADIESLLRPLNASTFQGLPVNPHLS
jgi:hypothetical protein